MKLTPRGEEVGEVVEVLLDKKLTTPDAVAKAVIRKVASLVGARDLYVLVVRPLETNRTLTYGPYASPGEAEKAVAPGMLAADYAVVSLGSTAKLKARLTQEPFFWVDMCKTCGHFPDDHLSDGNSRARCSLVRCKCKKFTKIAAKDARLPEDEEDAA